MHFEQARLLAPDGRRITMSVLASGFMAHTLEDFGRELLLKAPPGSVATITLAFVRAADSQAAYAACEASDGDEHTPECDRVRHALAVAAMDGPAL